MARITIYKGAPCWRYRLSQIFTGDYFHRYVTRYVGETKKKGEKEKKRRKEGERFCKEPREKGEIKSGVGSPSSSPLAATETVDRRKYVIRVPLSKNSLGVGSGKRNVAR